MMTDSSLTSFGLTAGPVSRRPRQAVGRTWPDWAAGQGRVHLSGRGIIAGRPLSETIYYRKVGGRSKRIGRLNVDLTPTHKYLDVSSWKAAKELLAKMHDTDKVFESSDMFKVLK